MKRFQTRHTYLFLTFILGVFIIAGCGASGGETGHWLPPGALDTIAPTVTYTDPVTVIVPGVPTTNVPINKKIAATFSEAMDPSTITTATFTLRQGATAVAGAVAYTGVTAVFTPQSPLAFSTTYTAKITTGATDLAGNQLSGNQATWPAASNYEWNFTTGVAPDTTPPTVILTRPVNAATNVAINTNISATFSEVMDPLTITAATFTLRQGATAVAGAVTYTGVTAVFTPQSPLAFSTAYTATITNGATDLAGNQLSGNQAPWPAASNYVWNFTTGVALDTTNPMVILTRPVDAATNVEIGTNISATFSEAMDPLTITNQTYYLKQGASVIAGTVFYSDITAVFTPLSPLALSTTYTATVTAEAKDLTGNQLAGNQSRGQPGASDYIWNFTTASTNLPPPGPSAPASCLGPGPVDMGAAGSFGVLVGPAGGATLSVTNPTSVTGDTGAASYVPAIGVSTLVGTKYTGVDAPYVAAKADMLTAIGCASARACSAGVAFNFAGAHDFGGDTLDPGVYCVTGAMMVNSNLTISNPGVYIFRSTGALTSANTINVSFGGTANAGNTSIFWVPTGAASLGTGNNFLGTIMPDASAAITLGATTTLQSGRVLSNSAVNLDTNTIAIP